MTGILDIPGLVAVEQKYLLNSTTLEDGEHNTQLQGIDKKISQLADVLSRDVGRNIITKQKEMSDIVNDESKRLSTKEQSIATAISSQNRLTTLNENYIKKYREYFKMISSIVVGLAIIAIFIFLRASAGIITIVVLIVGSLVCVYCAMVFVDISSRDNVYFDELNMGSLSNPVSGRDTSGNTLNFSGISLSCYGSACCSTGTVWDSTSQLCKTTESFVGNEKPWIPNEYDRYTKI